MLVTGDFSGPALSGPWNRGRPRRQQGGHSERIAPSFTVAIMRENNQETFNEHFGIAHVVEATYRIGF
jgi:hypothetical protein